MNITFSRKNKPINFTYSIDNKQIKKTNSVRDLGVNLDHKVAFSEHVESITARAYRNLGFVMRVCKPFTDIACLKIVYYAYVRSLLEFASIVWNPQYSIYINKIERIQKFFVRHLNFRTKRWFSSYEEACKFHGIITLEKRRTMLDMTFLYDVACSNLDCAELTSLIKYHIPGRPSRICTAKLFHIPFSRTNYRDNEYFLRATKVYNKSFSDIDLFCQSKAALKRKILDKIN